MAIHLDAQQRVVLFSGLKYCTEPSPDALAAYASSLGFGVSAPDQGAALVAQALQSNAASIGLRTQSITLMRDALFRMCEAANNGHMNPVAVDSFLRRSQDLTAAVLAIEQLTGAVVAHPVILTGSAGASASASLTSNQQLLDQAEARLQEKETELEEAETARDAAKAELDTAQEDLERKQGLYAAALEQDPDESEQATKDAKADRDAAAEARDEKKQALDDAEADVELKTTRRDDAKEVRDAVKDSRDAALTSAAANTSGSGEFSVIQPRHRLSDGATQHIATAVENIVEEVLGKDYGQDVCLSYLVNRELTEAKRLELAATVARLSPERVDALREGGGFNDLLRGRSAGEDAAILAACAKALDPDRMVSRTIETRELPPPPG